MGEVMSHPKACPYHIVEIIRERHKRASPLNMAASDQRDHESRLSTKRKNFVYRWMVFGVRRIRR